jgi:hypothetical protein
MTEAADGQPPATQAAQWKAVALELRRAVTAQFHSARQSG